MCCVELSVSGHMKAPNGTSVTPLPRPREHSRRGSESTTKSKIRGKGWMGRSVGRREGMSVVGVAYIQGQHCQESKFNPQIV